MKNVLKTTNRVVLLIVLLLCTAIKTSQAYFMNINHNKTKAIEVIKPIEPRQIEKLQLPKGNAVVSSNVVMVWKYEDGTVGNYILSNNDFNKLVLLASVIGEDRFKSIIDKAKGLTKEQIIDIVDRRLSLIDDGVIVTKLEQATNDSEIR